MQFEIGWFSFRKSCKISCLRKLLSAGFNTTAEIKWSTFMHRIQLIPSLWSPETNCLWNQSKLGKGSIPQKLRVSHFKETYYTCPTTLSKNTRLWADSRYSTNHELIKSPCSVNHTLFTVYVGSTGFLKQAQGWGCSEKKVRLQQPVNFVQAHAKYFYN